MKGWRIARALLAAFLAVWFGAIVPGHRRGVVQLPEARCEAECCAKTSHDSKSQGTPSHCAICYFALTLSNPPVVLPELKRLGLIERLAQIAALRSVSVSIPVTYLGRAPPGDCAA